MLRIYIKNTIEIEKTVDLIQEQNYITNVHRLKTGDFLLCFNESGEFLCKITESSKRNLIAIVIEKTNNVELKPNISLAVAIIKASRLEWLVEKIVEIGVKEIILLDTDRSIKRNPDLRRLNLIAKQAVQQSTRLHLPDIKNIPLKQLIKERESNLIIAHQDGGYIINMKNQIYCTSKNTITKDTVLIGPEGGFSNEEMVMLTNILKIKLGTHILRSETAALLGLYTLNNCNHL